MSGNDTHVYKIEVDGMDKKEYYEFDHHLDPGDVKTIWINHGIEKFGMGVMSIKDRIMVEKLSDPPEHKELKDGSRLS